jgi:hypothetical protein
MQEHLTYLRPENLPLLWDFCTLEILSRVMAAALEQFGPITVGNDDVGLRRIAVELHRNMMIKASLGDRLGLSPASYQQLKLMERPKPVVDLSDLRTAVSTASEPESPPAFAPVAGRGIQNCNAEDDE